MDDCIWNRKKSNDFYRIMEGDRVLQMKGTMMNYKERIRLYALLMLVFAFFFVFFFYFHPITLSDTDDWIFLTHHRDAWPMWKGWNPIRVFAEVTIPVISTVSAMLFYPITGNIFVSLSIGYAGCVAVAMAGLAAALWKMIRKKHSMMTAISICLFFLLCHFWIFRTKYQDNDYMLRTADACTVFFYVVPNLLNAILVLWLEEDDVLINWSFGTNQYAKKSLFFILTYFCIFSNIWAGMILAAYVGSRILFTLKPLLNKQKKGIDWLKENKLPLTLIALWIFSQVFEMSGGRADMIGKSLSYEMGETITSMLRTAAMINRRFAAVMLILLLVGIVVQTVEKEKAGIKATAFWGTCFLLSSIYLILSCSKTGHLFVTRPDVFYGLFFFGFMTVAVNAVELTERFPKAKAVVPLLLLIILNDCFSGGRTFRESNMLNLSPRIIDNVNNDIVNQLVKAEKAGLDHVVIEVPEFDAEDNWPYAVYAADAIGESMWKMHVIEQNIKVDSIMPSSEKNVLLSIGTRSTT